MLSRGIIALVALLAVLSTERVQGEVTLFGCVDAFVYLRCPIDETLEVTQVTAIDVKSPTFNCGFSSDSISPRSDLCARPEDCKYREDICRDKIECLFYISQTDVGKGQGLQITYGCKAGTSRIAGISAILIVTFLLFLIMAAAVFILWNKSGMSGEEYVEFENRLSRSSSVSSEINARYSRKGNKDSVEVGVSPDEIKVPPKVLDEKTASVI